MKTVAEEAISSGTVNRSRKGRCKRDSKWVPKNNPARGRGGRINLGDRETRSYPEILPKGRKTFGNVDIPATTRGSPMALREEAICTNACQTDTPGSHGTTQEVLVE